MRLLLDTHIFLWYITGDARVSQRLRLAIENADVAYVSVVSLWEAAIKYQLRKLLFPRSRSYGTYETPDAGPLLRSPIGPICPIGPIRPIVQCHTMHGWH
ncbi:MAG TPA: hypothetical protein VGF69_26285 [Thermoanaerobaculia bacterium]|jgi:hypothetical protein